MRFDARQLVYSAEKDWDEVLSITFVGTAGGYLALTSSSYEDEIGVELDDQSRTIVTSRADLLYRLDDARLTIELRGSLLRHDLTDVEFDVRLPPDADTARLRRALGLLVHPV